MANFEIKWYKIIFSMNNKYIAYYMVDKSYIGIVIYFYILNSIHLLCQNGTKLTDKFGFVCIKNKDIYNYISLPLMKQYINKLA